MLLTGAVPRQPQVIEKSHALETFAEECALCWFNICLDRTLDMKAVRRGAPCKHDKLHFLGKDLLIRSHIYIIHMACTFPVSRHGRKIKAKGLARQVLPSLVYPLPVFVFELLGSLSSLDMPVAILDSESWEEWRHLISTHSTKVLFLGQLLGISVIFPAMWLPAAFRGQGTGATSKGRVWMAMLTVVPITLVECTGWFQQLAGSFCLFCAWFLNLMGRKEAILILTRLLSIVASVSCMMIWCIFAWEFGICNKRELSETDMDKQVHLICFFCPLDFPLVT